MHGCYRTGMRQERQLHITAFSWISSSGEGVRMSCLPEFEAVVLGSNSSPRSSGLAKGGLWLCCKMGTSSTPLKPLDNRKYKITLVRQQHGECYWTTMAIKMKRQGNVARTKIIFLRDGFHFHESVYMRETDYCSEKLQRTWYALYVVKLCTGIFPAFCAALNTVIHSGLCI